MHVLFDFVPDRDMGVAIVYAGYYRYRHGNYSLGISVIERILNAAEIPTDFKAGELCFRSKIHPGGCVVTCPPVVGVRLSAKGALWRQTAIDSVGFDPMPSLLIDNAPIDDMPKASEMWELNNLGGTFEVDAPHTLTRDYRRFHIHASTAVLTGGYFTFSPSGEITGPRLYVATAVPPWLRRLAEYAGAYPRLPVSWIQHIRS